MAQCFGHGACLVAHDSIPVVGFAVLHQGTAPAPATVALDSVWDFG